eukprot:SAG31_NODE_32046_length_360_cov_11.839080_2_plen_55_part_01
MVNKNEQVLARAAPSSQRGRVVLGPYSAAELYGKGISRSGTCTGRTGPLSKCRSL